MGLLHTMKHFGNHTLNEQHRLQILSSDIAPETAGNLPGTITFDCSLVFEDYFRACPTGHCGIMLRPNLERLAAPPYQGHGVIFGSIWRGQDGFFNKAEAAKIEAPGWGPVSQIETWGAPQGQRFLMPDSVPKERLADHVLYHLVVQSVLTPTYRRYIRYAMWEAIIHKGAYDPFYDSGYMLDNNVHFPWDKPDAVLFDAATDPPAGAYNIAFSDVRMAWSANTV